jgi:hypothetical protein
MSGELFHKAICSATSASKDDRPPFIAYQIGNVLNAIGVLDEPEEMFGVEIDPPRLSHLANYRASLVVVAEYGNVSVEGCRKQHCLPPLGRPVEDPAYRGKESHVGHPVRLVDDCNSDLSEIDGALSNEIFEAARRRNEHIDTLAERFSLRLVPDATVDGECVPLHSVGQGGQLTFDLFGQLTGRCKDQARRAVAGRLGNGGEQWKTERKRLAGAGWRTT